MNGELVPWEDAKVHVLTHGLHYGTGVFEGVRGYDTETGRPSSATRTTSSACSSRQSSTTCRSLHARGAPRGHPRADRAQRLGRCYIRPIVFRGYGTMGLFPLDAPVDVAIAVWKWGAYLGDDGKTPASARRSRRWRRIGPDALIPHAKASGQYLNSSSRRSSPTRRATRRPSCSTTSGHVCEGSGENIFIVRDGQIVTPPQTASILDGISRIR